jgi:hypothetical protein
MTPVRSVLLALALCCGFSGAAPAAEGFDCAESVSDCLVAEARRSAEGLSRPILRDEAHFAIVVALAGLGRIDEARDEVASIHNAATRAEALGEISNAAAQSGDFETAFDIAFGMLDARNHSARIVALERLAETQAANGEIDAAFETVLAIDNPYRRSEAQAAIAVSVARSGDITGGIRAASRIATDYWFSSDQPQFKIASGLVSRSGEFDQFWFFEALVKIAVIQARNGDIVGALQTAKSIPDQAGRSRATGRVAAVQAENGDIGGAFETAERIDAAYGDLEAMTAIAGALAAAGNTDAALELAHEIQRAYGSGTALVAIATEQARRGAFDASIALVGHLGAVEDRTAALAAIAREFARRDRLDEAMDVLAQLADAKVRYLAMTDIVDMLARSGKADRALQLAMEHASARDIDDHIVTIVLTLADNGETDAAIMTASEIEDPMFRAIAFAGIAGRLS